MKKMLKWVYILLLALVVFTGGLMIFKGTQRADAVRLLPEDYESVERERTL